MTQRENRLIIASRLFVSLSLFVLSGASSTESPPKPVKPKPALHRQHHNRSSRQGWGSDSHPPRNGDARPDTGPIDPNNPGGSQR